MVRQWCSTILAHNHLDFYILFPFYMACDSVQWEEIRVTMHGWLSLFINVLKRVWNIK